MKILTKVSAVSLFILFFYSCGIYQPISSNAPKNNGTYQIDYLFEHDGCKVYRFQDYGRWVYFTNCSGNVTAFQNDSTRIPIVNTVQLSPAKK